MDGREVAELVGRFTAGCGCHGCRVVVPALVEALVFIGDEAALMRKGLRGAAPTPVQGVDAGLLLVELAAAHAVRREIPANAAFERRPLLRVAS